MDNPEEATGPSADLASSFYVEVEGVHLLKFFQTNRPLDQHVQCLKAFEMRPDDVVILAIPKSGTHFTWEIVSMLMARQADYERRTKDFSMMEAVEIEKLGALPSPRVFNSHLPLRLLPRQIKEKKVKVIHVYRNIKDVVVSMHFHYKQLNKDWTMDDQVEGICSNDVPGWKYVDYLKEMKEYQIQNPEVPFLALAFEDIVQDREKVVKELADFLQLEVSPELCRDIAEATKFSKLKQADKQKERGRLSTISIFRKGEVGDWRNHLTVAQSERLDAEVKQLETFDFHFRYTLWYNWNHPWSLF